MKRSLTALVAAVAVSGIFTQATLADDYYTTVPFLPTAKIGGEGATPARTVYGKEYSHNLPSPRPTPIW